MGTYINHLNHSLGDKKYSVKESFNRKRTFSSDDILIESGFKNHYLCHNKSTYDLAREAVENLSKGYDLKNIDTVIYATCLTRNGNIGSWSSFEETKDVKSLMDFPISHLQSDFDMNNAFLMGLNQTACTSLLGAIRVAKSFISSEDEINDILCLTADRFPDEAIYEQGYNLISDGAAACVVSNQAGPFEIIDCHQISNGAMSQASDDETAGFYFNYTHRLISELLERNHMTINDIQWIVPQNTNIKAWQVLTSILKFDFDKVLMPTREEIGHCISGDNIINLQHCNNNKIFKEGDYILMPMAGFGLNWSCILLQKSQFGER